MARWTASQVVGLGSRVLRQIVRTYRAPQRRTYRVWLPACARVTKGVFVALFLWLGHMAQTRRVRFVGGQQDTAGHPIWDDRFPQNVFGFGVFFPSEERLRHRHNPHSSAAFRNGSPQEAVVAYAGRIVLGL